MLVSDWLHTPAEMLAQKPAKQASATVPRTGASAQAMWEATKTQYIFYGWMLIRRHEGGRPAATGRAQAGRNFTGRAMEWLLEWESAVRAPDGVAMLLESRPAILPILRTAHRSPGARRTILRRKNSRWSRRSRSTAACRCQGWLAQIVSQCDGVKTWREHFAAAREAGIVDPGGTAEDFAQVLRPSGVGGNSAELADWPLPE